MSENNGKLILEGILDSIPEIGQTFEIKSNGF